MHEAKKVVNAASVFLRSNLDPIDKADCLHVDEWDVAEKNEE